MHSRARLPSPTSLLTIQCCCLLVLIGLMGVGCSRSGASKMQPLSVDEAEASHRQMMDALERVAEESSQTNEYFNSESQIERAKRALTNAVAARNIVAELESSKELAVLQLNSGKSAEAAKSFVRACDLIPVVEKRRLAMIPDSSKEKLYLSTAIAFLRQAEDENCVHCTDGSACILSPSGSLKLPSVCDHQSPFGHCGATTTQPCFSCRHQANRSRTPCFNCASLSSPRSPAP